MRKLKHKIISLITLCLALCIMTAVSAPSSALAASCESSTQAGLQDCLKTNPIVKNIINPAVNFLSAAVGIAVVGALIMGGIQYSMAGGSPDAVSKAKQRITNALLAFAAYLLIFGFLQWIIPGGLFS